MLIGMLICYEIMNYFKKLSISFCLPIALLFLIFQGIIIKDAYAYLDPGSGSIVFQMIIGALIGIGVAIKVYWEKLKYKFSSTFERRKTDA